MFFSENLRAVLDLQVGDDDDGRTGRTDRGRRRRRDGRRTDGGQDRGGRRRRNGRRTTTGDGRRTPTTDGRNSRNRHDYSKYFRCLPLKTNTYEFHSTLKIISGSRRTFLWKLRCSCLFCSYLSQAVFMFIHKRKHVLEKPTSKSQLLILP